MKQCQQSPCSKGEGTGEFRLGRALQIINGRFRRLGDENLSKHGINIAQLRILAYLARNKEKRIVQRDLEEDFGIRRSSVTSILQNMEKNGYLIRENSPEDARVKIVKLTAKGEELDEDLRKYIHLLEKELLQGVTPQEQKTLESVFLKMLANLDQMERNGV
jgi:DNA-binding MarR family transcriptional regulator